MSLVCVGMHVEIKRSDGRVHSAVVSSCNPRNERYVLEWNEKGETKAKEIGIKELLETNPTLRRSMQIKVPLKLDEDEDDDFLLVAFQEQKKNLSRVENLRANTTVSKIKQPAAVVRPSEVILEAVVEEPAVIDHPAEPTRHPLIQQQIRPKSPISRAPVATVKPAAPLRLTQQVVAPTNANFAFAKMIHEYRQNVMYTPLTLSDEVKDVRIMVCVRNRPLNKKEKARGEVEVVSIPNKDHLILHQPMTKVDLTKSIDNQKFRFDYVFDANSTNELVYRFTAQPLVEKVFEGGTATCFAYGQTGSGKTHTMGGDFVGGKQDGTMGIYAFTTRDIFTLLARPENRRQKFSVTCSFFEIYGAKILDLLNGRNQLKILEDGKNQMQVVGLKEFDVANENDVMNLINLGSSIRTAGTTSANANSSRSHAIFQLVLKKNKKQYGKISLIDLAGNERGQDTRDCDRERRLEGAEINKSMLSLKECIRAMATNSTHIPFRGSKLTMALRDSFIGEKSRTVMISMISPGLASCEHSLNTLRYADRVKCLGTDDDVATPLDDAHFIRVQQESDEELDEEEVEPNGFQEAKRAVSECFEKIRANSEELSRLNSTNAITLKLQEAKALAKQYQAAITRWESIMPPAP